MDPNETALKSNYIPSFGRLDLPWDLGSSILIKFDVTILICYTAPDWVGLLSPAIRKVQLHTVRTRGGLVRMTFPWPSSQRWRSSDIKRHYPES